MIEVILTAGIPASRKSSWAKEFVAKDPANWMRINNDDMRIMSNGCINNKKHDEVIRQTRLAMITAAAAKKLNLVIDNVNLNKTAWSDTVEAVRLANVDAKVYEKIFFVPLEQALEDNAKRTGPARLDDKVIKQWWKLSGGANLSKRTPKEEIIKVNKGLLAKPLKWNDALPSAIMCDLDGTLALFEHHRGPYDATNCHLDLPNKAVADLVNLAYKSGSHIIFCSGREDKHETPTRQFLAQHLPDLKNFTLHMRKSGDSRNDAIIKTEMFNNNIRDKYKVHYVLDDRSRVVDAWRNIGLTCFQVAPGNF